MEEVLIIGTPLTLGILASGIAEFVKRSAFFPVVSKGNPLAIRLLLAVVAVALQAAFNYINNVPLEMNVLVDAALNYFAASTAYLHLFKPIERKLGPQS